MRLELLVLSLSQIVLVLRILRLSSKMIEVINLTFTCKVSLSSFDKVPSFRTFEK